MKINFEKLIETIKEAHKTGSSVRITQLLIFRSWLKLQSARRKYQQAVDACETGSYPDFELAVVNLRKAKQRQHLTSRIKAQTAFDLGMINGDELFAVNQHTHQGLSAGRVPVHAMTLFTQIIEPLLKEFALTPQIVTV